MSIRGLSRSKLALGINIAALLAAQISNVAIASVADDEEVLPLSTEKPGAQYQHTSSPTNKQATSSVAYEAPDTQFQRELGNLALVITAQVSVSVPVDAQLLQNGLREQLIAEAMSNGVKLIAIPPESVQVLPQQRDYHSFASKGVDTVLEIEQALTFAGPDRTKPDYKDVESALTLTVEVLFRLVRTKDNSVIFADNYYYHGPQLEYAKWRGNRAERTIVAIKRSNEAIGKDISDRLFALYPFPFRQEVGQLGSCGLIPFNPSNNKTVDLSPMLSWQEFPRSVDKNTAAEEMAQVKNVKYDLIVAVGDNGETPEVIYRREGLEETSHKLEITLKPNTRYFWSIRAQFELNGRKRVTEWNVTCPFEQQLIVDAQLYRFNTAKRANRSLPQFNGR